MTQIFDAGTRWQSRALLRVALLLALIWQTVPAKMAYGAEQSDELLQAPLEQLLEIEVEKVYSASRFEQNVTEAPASVSIVTSDDIKKSGHRTLAEILNSVRGFMFPMTATTATWGSGVSAALVTTTPGCC